eukprot:753287-Hanusia_phi.AAC.1
MLAVSRGFGNEDASSRGGMEAGVWRKIGSRALSKYDDGEPNKILSFPDSRMLSVAPRTSRDHDAFSEVDAKRKRRAMDSFGSPEHENQACMQCREFVEPDKNDRQTCQTQLVFNQYSKDRLCSKSAAVSLFLYSRGLQSAEVDPFAMPKTPDGWGQAGNEREGTFSISRSLKPLSCSFLLFLAFLLSCPADGNVTPGFGRDIASSPLIIPPDSQYDRHDANTMRDILRMAGRGEQAASGLQEG